MSHPCLPPLVCFARATRTATLPLRLWTRLDTKTALSRCLQNYNVAFTSKGGVSRRCGGDGAPHDVSRLAMLASDVFVSSRHSWFCVRCPSQAGLDSSGRATLSGCQLTSNWASLRGLFVDASSASCMSIEHAWSTAILKAKALIQCSCPTLVSRLWLRSCDPNRYVVTAATDAT